MKNIISILLFMLFFVSINAEGAEPFSSVAENDLDCNISIQAAEELELLLATEMEIAGVYFADTKTCMLYDITSFELLDDNKSALESFEDYVAELRENMKKQGIIVKYEAIKN